MKKRSTVTATLLLFLFASLSTQAQSIGQYRTKATGIWTDLGVWERYNGTIWTVPIHTPTNSDGIITIRTGDTITLTSGSLTIDQTTIESGGRFNNAKRKYS